MGGREREEEGWGRVLNLGFTFNFSEFTPEMPPKRRLSATSGGDEGDDDTKEQVHEPGRKKKKMDPGQQMQVELMVI